MVQPNAHVAGEVVQPDVLVADEVATTYPVPFAIADTEVTTASTRLLVHTDGAFLGGLIHRSVLTEYVEHVAY